MNWRITTAIMTVLSFFATTSLTADPFEMEAHNGVSDATMTQACAPDKAAVADGCATVSPYSFNLSEWVNQPIIPDHLNVAFDAGPSNPDSTTSGPSRSDRNERMLGLNFQDDDDWVQKLKEVDDLSVMTFWQTEATRLFLGVNEDGLPGLHLKQRELENDPHDDETEMQRKMYRSTGNDGRPLVHSQSLTYDVPDLSKGYSKTDSKESAGKE